MRDDNINTLQFVQGDAMVKAINQEGRCKKTFH